MNYTLCLSGGGFRATLFHIGVIRRLIQLDLFKHIERINSVSGGSIAAAIVMMELSKCPFSSITDFDNRVLIPIIRFIQKSPRNSIYRVVPLRKSPERFMKLLDRELFNRMAFTDLIKSPVWACYSTSLYSAKAWKFSQSEVGDSSNGNAEPNQRDSLSFAVAASACFPPLFRPVKFDVRGRAFNYKYRNGLKVEHRNDTPPKKVLLSDGGLYDNLGSESAITQKANFIISDASGVLANWPHGKPNIYNEIRRPIDIAMDQVVKLRRRLIFNNLIESSSSILIEASKPISVYTEGVNTKKVSPTSSENMPLYKSVPIEFERAIGEIRTDLNAFHDYEIQALVWNGMVKIDAAIKRWVPNLIESRELWSDTPTLKIEEKNIWKALDILKRGQKQKVWGNLHVHLNDGDALIANLGKLL